MNEQFDKSDSRKPLWPEEIEDQQKLAGERGIAALEAPPSGEATGDKNGEALRLLLDIAASRKDVWLLPEHQNRMEAIVNAAPQVPHQATDQDYAPHYIAGFFEEWVAHCKERGPIPPTPLGVELLEATIRLLKEGPEATPSATALPDAVPVADIEAEIAHIQQNAEGLRRFKGEENEARCRELCAMYLREFIQSWRFQQQISRLSHTPPEEREPK